MAKTRGPEAIPDDIELLNIQRYPESAPASLVAFVRNSKLCQKRLEELLKGLPGRKPGKSVPDYRPPVDSGSMTVSTAPPASKGAGQMIKKYLEKLFMGLSLNTAALFRSGVY